MLRSSHLVLEANDAFLNAKKKSEGETYRTKRFESKNTFQESVDNKLVEENANHPETSDSLEENIKVEDNEKKLEREDMTDVGGEGKHSRNLSLAENGATKSSSERNESKDKIILPNNLNAKDFVKRAAEKFEKTIQSFAESKTAPTISQLSPATIKTQSFPSAAANRGEKDYDSRDGGGKKELRSFSPQKISRNEPESDCTFIHPTAPTAAACTQGDDRLTSGVQLAREEGVGGTLSAKQLGCSATASSVHFGVQGASRSERESVVHEQQDGSEVRKKKKSSTNKNNNNNNKDKDFLFQVKFCRCENWPSLTSVREVDVDAPILVSLSTESSPELCVECGLRVVPSPIQDVLLSVLKDREAFPATPPPDVAPPPPPHFDGNGQKTWSDEDDEDLYLSREIPVSVDSPNSCDSDSPSLSSSDLSTVILVDDFDEERRQLLHLDCESVSVKTCSVEEDTASQEGR
jgi:hypothetical protein